MSQTMNRKLLYLTTLNSTDKNLILTGIKIASIFKKKLCLVYNQQKRRKIQHNHYKSILQKYLVPVKNEISGFKSFSIASSSGLQNCPNYWLTIMKEFYRCTHIRILKLFESRC